MCWTFHIVPVRTRANAFISFMLLAGAAMVFLPSSLWHHIADESRNGGLTLTAAVNNGLAGIRATPVGGFGAGSMSAQNPGAVVHAFSIFSETGVVGVAWFITMLGVLFLSAESMSGATKSFVTVLATWAAGVCGINWDCSQSAWLLFGLLAAHWHTAARCRRSGATEQAKSIYVKRPPEV